MQTRILIVLEDGKFKAASLTDDTGTPMPIDLEALADALPMFNAATVLELQTIQSDHAQELSKRLEVISAKDAEIAALATEKARIEQGFARVSEAVQNPDIDTVATALIVQQIAEELATPEKERRKAELRKQIVELEAAYTAVDAKAEAEVVK
jgi:hypothetical protein